MLFDTCKR